tara:strand:+ start:12324 stop:14420 length:2097 start_codon:yes stop_codon:yes gene_type:complete
MRILTPAILLVAVFITACGGSSTSSSGRANNSPTVPAEASSGRLIDSPVMGLKATTRTLSGLTDIDGGFLYREAETVNFSIAGLSLGSSTAAPILTLLDLVPGARADYSAGMSFDDVLAKYPAIVNIARFLQSLDVDRNTANGIAIPEEAAQLIATYANEIQFAVSDLFVSEDSPAVKYICEVQQARGRANCGLADIVSVAAATEELSETEAAVASGAALNRLPVASAGDDQTLVEGETVILTGVAGDDEGGIVAMQWQHTDRNGIAKSNPVQITDANKVEASFVAPEVVADTILYFSFTATDDQGGQGSDIVNVLVLDNDSAPVNQKPVAVAGDDQIVSPGATVILDGSASSDADGEISYNWLQTGDGERVGIVNGGQAVASFTAPSPAEAVNLQFTLTVSDDQGASDSAVVSVLVKVEGDTGGETGGESNQPPVADAGADQNVESGSVVSLDGSASSDPDTSDELSYSWSQDGGPVVTLDNQNSAQPSFTAPDVDDVTALNFILVISDAELSDSDGVTITVTPKPEAFSACQPSSFDAQSCGNDFCASLAAEGVTEQCAAFVGDIVNNENLAALQDCAADAQACAAFLQGALFEQCQSYLGENGSQLCDPFAQGLSIEVVECLTSDENDACLAQFLSDNDVAACSPDALPDSPCWPFATEAGEACLPFQQALTGAEQACNATLPTAPLPTMTVPGM